MQIKMTTDYAIRTMLYLAKTGRVTTAAEIAEAMRIPRNYLVCMISVLRKAGLVGTQFGQKGGYYIEKDPGRITLYEIVSLLEGNMSISGLEGKDRTAWTNAGACDSDSVYGPVEQKIEQMLRDVTIGDLMAPRH